MADYLQDHVALFGADHVSNFAALHCECLVFQFLGERAALEHSEIAALSSRGTVRGLLRHIFEARPGTNLLEQVIGFGFSRRQGRGIVGLLSGPGVRILWGIASRSGSVRRGALVCGSRRFGSWFLRSNQDLT